MTGARQRGLAALLGLLAWSSQATAQPFTPVGVGNGLKARIVTALLVDHQGYLWIGSREGLFRYDGYEPRAYLPEDAASGSLGDTDVRSVHEDPDGILWIGTHSGGLSRLDPLTGAVAHYRHDSREPASIGNDSVLAITTDADGDLWVATPAGLSRLDRPTGRFEHYRHDAGDPGSLSSNQATSLHLGRSGRLWIGTLGGAVNLWNPQTGAFTRYDLAALTGGDPEFNDVFSLYEDQRGVVWAGTRIGLVRLDVANGAARGISLPWPSEYLPAISSLAADEDGRLWLGTLAHGLLVIDPATGQWLSRGTAASRPLQDQPQVSLAVAGDMLFVGTWGAGVFRALNHATLFQWLGSDGERGDVNVTALLASDTGGRPWVGTHDNGLHRVDGEDRAIRPVTGLADELRSLRVLGLAHDPSGWLWAAGDKGVFAVDPSAPAAARQLEQAPPRAQGGNPVRTLLRTSGDILWIGTDGAGLGRIALSGTAAAWYRHEPGRADSLSGDAVTALLEEPGRALWVGTRSNGLNLCRDEPWSCRQFPGRDQEPSGLANPQVTAMLRDREQRVWVATAGGGLHRVLRDAAGAVSGFERWGRAQGLVDEVILSIEQDDDGSLWLSSRQALSRLDPESGQVINYVSQAGLPGVPFNPGASARDSHFIYFGSVRGVLALPLGSPFTPRQPSPVVITSIERTPPGGAGSEALPLEGELKLPRGEIVTLQLATLDLSESLHEYAYRLRRDDPWISLGTQRRVILHGLASGRYEFQARGRDVFGSWGESRPLALEIVPPFWLTRGFQIAVTAALLSLALVLHLLRQAALRRRADEAQRLAGTRERALEEQLGDSAELAVLTPRQKEVLQLIAEGLSTKQIADRLGLSVKTIEAHRANLMDRLQIHDVPGLVRLAVRSRLVSPFE